MQLLIVGESILVTIMLLLSVTGIFGNILSLIVFSQRKFRRLSINIFLMALSLCDLLLLVFGTPAAAAAPLSLILPRWEKQIVPIFTFSAAYLHPVSVMCQSASIWLLAAVTVERWAAVCRPFTVGVYFTRKRALRSSCCIMVAAVLFNMIKFWEMSRPTPFTLQHLLANNSVYVIWKLAVSRYLATYLVPLALLFVLNALVARQLVRSANLRTEMNATQRNDRTTATMLLYVVLMFICCYTMSLVVQLLEAIDRSIFLSTVGYLLGDLNNTLIICNSSTTWLFYLRFSTNYRRTVTDFARKVRGGRSITRNTEDSLKATVEYRARDSRVRRSQNSYLLMERAPSAKRSSSLPRLSTGDKALFLEHSFNEANVNRFSISKVSKRSKRFLSVKKRQRRSQYELPQIVVELME